MVKYVMVALVAVLAITLLINLMMIWGVNKVAKALETDLIADHLKKDIQVLHTELEFPDTTLSLCRTSFTRRREFSEKLQSGEGTAVTVPEHQLQLQALLISEAKCYKEMTWHSISRDMGSATSNALYAFTKSLEMASWHAGLKWDQEEQEVYTRVVNLKKSSPARHQIIAEAEGAMPVLEGILAKLQQRLANAYH